MSKYLRLFAFCCIFSLGLSACDTDLEGNGEFTTNAVAGILNSAYIAHVDNQVGAFHGHCIRH